MKIKLKIRLVPFWGIAIAAITVMTMTACPKEDDSINNSSAWNLRIAEIKRVKTGKHTMVVNGDVGINGTTALNFDMLPNGSLTVTLKGKGKVYLTSQGSIFRIGKNQTLIIDSANLTLEGLSANQNGAEKNNNHAVVYIDGGTLELKNGTISGNTNTNMGGGVLMSGGTFTMSGGTITENNAQSGGGVNMSTGGSVFEMSGGEISGNNAQVKGGGVYINGGNFTMKGGTIVGNIAEGPGSGVYKNSPASFTKTGGEIDDDDIYEEQPEEP